MKILDRLPILARESTIVLPDGQAFTVKPYQVVIRISLRFGDQLSPEFPAFLDSGHNHNFSISEDHLRAWANVDPATIDRVGMLRINGQDVPLRKANVVLYRNMKGTGDFSLSSYELSLSHDRGIAVHKSPIATLPILGIRGLMRQNLRLIFDGQGNFVTLSTPVA